MITNKDVEVTLPVSRLIMPLYESNKQFFIYEGAMRSGKTWQIIMAFIIEGFRPIGEYSPNLGKKKEGPIVMRAFRKTRDDCRNTVAQEFLKIMKRYCYKVFDRKKWANWMYTFPDGSQYHFSGCDPDRLPGYTQDMTHLEEVMEIDYDSAQQIIPRTSGRIICSFNPTITHHWIFEKVMRGDPSNYVYVHSTYKDNYKNLQKSQIHEIEKWEPTDENIKNGTADHWRWQVYGLGQRCKREGAVINNWDVVDDFPERTACIRWGYGLDFGFTIDPSVLVLCALCNDDIYVKQIFYETGLTTLSSPSNTGYSSIQKYLLSNKIGRGDKIVCDSARPDSITELRRAGFNAVAAKKKKGSIESGLDTLKTYFIHVHRSSQDIQREFENYCYGNHEGTFEGADHAVDAIRYWGMSNLRTIKPISEGEEKSGIIDFGSPSYTNVDGWPSEWLNAGCG